MSLRRFKLNISKDRVFLANQGGDKPKEIIADFGKHNARAIANATRVANNERILSGLNPEFLPDILGHVRVLIDLLQTEYVPNDGVLRAEIEQISQKYAALIRLSPRAVSQLAQLEPIGSFVLLATAHGKTIEFSPGQLKVDGEVAATGDDPRELVVAAGARISSAGERVRESAGASDPAKH